MGSFLLFSFFCSPPCPFFFSRTQRREREEREAEERRNEQLREEETRSVLDDGKHHDACPTRPESTLFCLPSPTLLDAPRRRDASSCDRRRHGGRRQSTSRPSLAAGAWPGTRRVSYSCLSLVASSSGSLVPSSYFLSHSIFPLQLSPSLQPRPSSSRPRSRCTSVAYPRKEALSFVGQIHFYILLHFSFPT